MTEEEFKTYKAKADRYAELAAAMADLEQAKESVRVAISGTGERHGRIVLVDEGTADARKRVVEFHAEDAGTILRHAFGILFARSEKIAAKMAEL